MEATTTEFKAYEMPSEFGQPVFDVYSTTAFVGHFKAFDKDEAIAKARRVR